MAQGPTAVLQPGHLGTALPALGVLLALYYVCDVGTFLLIFVLLEDDAPWQIWWRMYRPTLLPELAACTIGILATIVWHDDPVALALMVLPVVALRVAFGAIARTEAQAAASRLRSVHLEMVLHAGQHARLQGSQAQLLLAVAEAASVTARAASATVYLRDDDDPTQLKRIAVAPPDAVVVGPVAWAIPALGQELQEPGVAEAGGTMLLPLEREGVGVQGLVLLLAVPLAPDRDARDTLAILTSQAALALENTRLHERALAQASEDGLTGLLNHKAFQLRLEEEVARAARSNRPLALLMVDLDNFGTINNTFGHQTGDATLKAVAAVLRESERASDVPARYGGDEFAVILPETNAAEAAALAQRICTALASVRLVEGTGTVRLGASVGIAALPDHARTREELVRAADHAQYAAKRAGKGGVGRPEDAALLLEHDPARLAAELAHANLATVEALAAAVDAKDPYTRGHSQRVSAYAGAIAQALGLTPLAVARVRLAGLLHDVGKIAVPDAVLTKAGALSAEEFAIIRQHPAKGAQMLASVPFLQEILPAVRHHHEHWDGRGYPDGLVAETIPADASILMVADAFDAMTSSRTYRPALPPDEARRRLREASGAQFDPRIVAAFEQAIAQRLLTLLSGESSAEVFTSQAA